MSQTSKGLDQVYTLSKLLHCEGISLSAWSGVDNHQLLVIYTGSGNFICYYLTEEEPIIKQIPWFSDPIHTPVSIDFSPSGFFLLVLSKSCHLYILPILSVVDSTVKTQICLDTGDLTIHAYPFASKSAKSKGKSKSPNSSLSLISSLSLQSGSSNSNVNDKQRSSISSSSSASESQGNDNVTKLKETLNAKCEVGPCAVCWWQSTHNSQDVAVIGTKSGDILFVDLITGLKIGDTNVKGEIKSLSICHDKSAENLFLLITMRNNDQYKLILEQRSLSYLWSGRQNLNGNEEGDVIDTPNTGNGNGNYLPSARARLQGLKQMSAEKLASLKHKIAETRSKIGTKQGLSEDGTGKLGGPPPENLSSVVGDTMISPQCCRDANVLIGYYAQTQVLTVHSMNLVTLFVHKLPVETEEVVLGDHVIFVLSNNKTAFQVISSKLTETWLDQTNDFNADSILGKWDFRQRETNDNERKPAEEKKPTLAKPDLIPEESLDGNPERILNVYKSQGRVEEFDVSKRYNVEKTKEELPEPPKMDSFFVVTDRGVYVVESNENVVKRALDLVLETQELEKAERICTIFGINLQKLLELAGDIKLAALEFPTAIALYKLSKCGLLKSIIKLACGNHCSQVLNYSTMLMANSVSDMSLTERIHLSNLMLMAYTQQILKSENSKNLTEKFIDFLQKNSYFDEILAVSVTGQSLLFPCLHKLITYKGLILDGYNVLTKLMDRFMNSKVLEWSLNKSEFWKCATEADLIEAMVIKSGSFSVYANYVSQHLDDLEPKYLERLLTVLDPTAPSVRPVARSFKKESSFDNDDTQTVFPYGKLIELFLLALLIKLHKMETGEEDYERELILPEVTDEEENSLALCEESFGSGDASGDEIWPIRKDIQGDGDKFKKMVETILSCGYGHTSLIRNGCVYTWGQTAKGCLGHGPTMSRYASPSPVAWLTGFKLEVSVVSCGKFHTAALTNNGVYTWGCSRYGQLGLGDVHESPHPRLVTCLAHENVITVKCGQFHTLALTNQGSVFAWGWGVHGQLGLGNIDNQRRPKYMHTLKEHFIVDVAAGHGHSLVLSDKGHVYSFGSSVFGQLGTGNNAKSSVPVLVKGINGKVVSIATGYFHNLALTETGAIYTWGSSPQCLRFQAQARKRSRLLQNPNAATNPTEGEAKPQEETQEQPPEGGGLLDKTESELHLAPSIVDTSNVSGKIIQISCGCHHSALVTDSGGLYTWGRSIDGQLGNGSHREVQIPTQINANGFKADRVSCGCEFTMAEEKHTGKIYCWGSNSVGQLAIPIKESATKSLDGKLVLIKSCKRIVRLLDRGAGSNSVDTPREIPEIPPPTFTYRTLTSHITSTSGKLSHFDPRYSQRSLHFVLEKFTNFINLPFIFKKSLEYGNFQAASKISLLQNKCKQSVVYQLKALQSLPKYHVKSGGSYLEKQGEGKDGKDGKESQEASEIHFFTVEGGHEDLCDESRSGETSALLDSNEEKCEDSSNLSCVEDEKLKQLKTDYMNHAKHILEVYLKLNSTQMYEDFDNCFILETGIQFWTAEKLPMTALENFLRGKLDDIYYDFGYLLFCMPQRDEQVSILEQFSSSFLLEVTSRILSRVEKNESCVEYLETMSRLLTKEDSPGKTAPGRKKRTPKRKKQKSETFVEEIRDNLQQQNLGDNFIKISYGDVIEENVYFFSCGHHHSLKSLEEDCKLFQEITDETVASKLMSFYRLLDTESRGDLACPSCVRDYLRQ